MSPETRQLILVLVQVSLPAILAAGMAVLIPLARYLITQTKNSELREISLLVVQAVEQMLKESSGRMKYTTAASMLKHEASDQLKVTLRPEQLKYLIESAVHEMNAPDIYHDLELTPVINIQSEDVLPN